MASCAFELDQFVVDDERLQITGRWLGVRGRRFVRPSLTAVVDGRSKRALAELEHKPWAAEDGGDWTAAFRWSGPVADVQGFELAVAPDLAVRLPPPSNGDGERELTLPVVQPGEEADRGGDGRAEPAREVASDSAGGNEEARDAGDQRGSELDKAAVIRAQASAVRRNALSIRERAIAQRDKLAAERDAARAERAEALAAREEAFVAATKAQSQREAALAARVRAEEQRDEALAARDRAIAERDDALAARGVTSVQLERARAELNHTKRDLALWQRASARLRNEPTDEPSAAAARRVARTRVTTSDGGSAVSPRVLTLLAIAGAVLLLVIILVTSGGVVPVAGH